MEDVPWFVSLIVAWLPFVFLIGLAIWITATIRGTLRTQDGRSLAQAIDDHTREMRRSNDLLQQAITGMRRPDTIEPKS